MTPENVTTMTDTSADSEASITTVTIEIPLLPDMLDEVDDEPGRGNKVGVLAAWRIVLRHGLRLPEAMALEQFGRFIKIIDVHTDDGHVALEPV